MTNHWEWCWRGFPSLWKSKKFEKTGNMWFRAFYYGKSVSKTNNKIHNIKKIGYMKIQIEGKRSRENIISAITEGEKYKQSVNCIWIFVLCHRIFNCWQKSNALSNQSKSKTWFNYSRLCEILLQVIILKHFCLNKSLL